jgi:CheY-like chemotaxis protein
MQTQDSASGVAGVTILYIEDNAANLGLVEMIFSAEPDVEIVPANSVEAGFEAARSRAPDLILLDLHLPDGFGEDVLARLKADPATSDIPVIAVTADARKGRAEQLLAAGAEAYYTKPIPIGRLVDRVMAIREARSEAA